MERLISLLGLFVMMGLAWLMSSHKRRVSPRVVIGGLALQLVFAVLILKTDLGKDVFDWLGSLVKVLLDQVDKGTEFLFRGYVTGDNALVALKILPTIVFFSALMSMLYHFGIVQRVIRVVAFVMQRTLGTSGSESLSAAANIFVGQTEAPLVVRPYVETMTRSELMALMVGGFATVAGGVLAVYAGAFKIDPGHLITASVISAPAALLIAKILQPEVEESKTLGTVKVDIPRHSVNVVDAIARGTTDGVKLAINVGAMLLVFLALIALLNTMLAWTGGLFGYEEAAAWSLEKGLGWVFAPFAWVMGVESGECLRVGQLLGVKMAANEFIAYSNQHDMMGDEATQLSKRSEIIATYALCGFANFSSIGIQLGGIGPLAPSRQADLARIGLRAMLGGTLAAFMTACIAGMLI